MLIRHFAFVVLMAGVASCTSDTPEPATRTTPPDSAIAPGATPVASPQPGDTSAAGGTPTDAEPDTRLLTPDGWGPLRIGMSRAEVVAAAGEDANPGAVGGPEPDICDEFRPRNAPDGVLVMVERDTLTRISVSRNTDIATPAGFSVGDRGASVRDQLGREAVVEPHKYWEAPAMYITLWRESPQGAERRGVRYEVDADGAIVHIRAGGPSIEYVEGCL